MVLISMARYISTKTQNKQKRLVLNENLRVSISYKDNKNQCEISI